MIYCISDIHGEYDLFIQLLKEINFSSNDKMYICGDMIDKGKDSIKLLKFIKSNPNLIPIIGDHEYEFLKFYHLLMADVEENFTSDDDKYILDLLKNYFPFDGALLDWDIVEWLDSLPYYIEEDSFICVHAGLPLETTVGGQALDKIPETYLLYDKEFRFNDTYVPNTKCVFFGHTPNILISNDCKISLYEKTEKTSVSSISNYYKVNLDTGTWLYGVLGCFCVDTCKEYYVLRKES